MRTGPPLVVLVVAALVVPSLAVAPAGAAPATGSHAAVAPPHSVATGAPATRRGASDTTTANPGVNITFYTSLTPGTPGEVRTGIRFTVPDDVTSLTARLPAEYTVVGTRGFRRSAPDRYEWTRSTDRPSLTVRVPANVTVTRGRGGSAVEGFVFVDTGEWALVRAPALRGLTYSGLGQRAPIRREQVVNGSGAAGETMLFLGPVETYDRESEGQRLRLVVPRAAELRESPAAVLDALSRANRALTLGARDDRVFVVAAPTAGVSYGSTGLQRGDADMWVRDVQRLDTPDNVWVHEYVHTRQTYRPTDATRWTVEGMADYYAVTRALETGRIDYSRYRRHLSVGARGRYGDVVLANESTWAGTTANYWKGALVFAAVDRRIRIETDGEATLQDAIRRAQARSGDRLNQSTFLGSVEAVAGPDARAFARRYTETDATPDTWNRSAHRRVFGDLPDIGYRFEGFGVEGPYRNGSLAAPTVVPGETLVVRAVVRNDGDRAGNYTATLRAGDRPVGTRRGRLRPGESARLRYRVPFGTTGDPVLVLGGARRAASVVSPATPNVTALRAPATARPGESVRLAATVRNPADRPADGRVALRVDGAVLRGRRVRLAPGGSTTLAARTTFERAGDHVVRAGGRRVTVRVETATDRTGTATAARTGTAAPTGTPTTGEDPGRSRPATPTRSGGDAGGRPTATTRPGTSDEGSTGRTDEGDAGTSDEGDAGGTSDEGDAGTSDDGTATATPPTPGGGGQRTPSDAGGPGFGVPATLVAVLALAVRRRVRR